jgi:V/A-type H+/Na+-transporting ATPase subunit D
MAKIKYTKNELKSQRDALARFERYLPTLQLKKQQLQTEMRKMDKKIEEQMEEERRARQDLDSWIDLFSEDFDFESCLKISRIETDTGNIAGVRIPILKELVCERSEIDLFSTPAWLDDGLDVLEKLLRLRVELGILKEQKRLLGVELRTTTQRVNLFEKVKIPEARQIIRMIRIFLGDQQTAAVARSKIAKSKSSEQVYA